MNKTCRQSNCPYEVKINSPGQAPVVVGVPRGVESMEVHAVREPVDDTLDGVARAVGIRSGEGAILSYTEWAGREVSAGSG